jgi:hypothetical protein
MGRERNLEQLGRYERVGWAQVAVALYANLIESASAKGNGIRAAGQMRRATRAKVEARKMFDDGSAEAERDNGSVVAVGWIDVDAVTVVVVAAAVDVVVAGT